MKIIQSTYQPFLTLDYIVNESENKLFDRKSSRIKPSDLAPIISAFANADGGTVVIGVSDKSRGSKKRPLILFPQTSNCTVPCHLNWRVVGE